MISTVTQCREDASDDVDRLARGHGDQQTQINAIVMHNS